jgi:phosphatidate cytidylyltransferase
MKTRIIAAGVLLPLLLLIVLAAPKIFTAILFGLASAVAAYELLIPTGFVRHGRLALYSMVSALLVGLWCGLGAQQGYGMLLVLVFVAALFGEMMASHIKLQFQEVVYCVVGGLLLPYMLCALVRVHTMYYGRYFILIAFVLAFLSDTGAYFAGLYLGKHKLAPVISPKKTVEGMIGGVLAAIVGMLLYTLVLDLAFDFFQVNYLYAVLYGVVGSLASVFGDLSFSVIKRQCGIKDYGNLIPGHGGILDRFDSMMIVAPLVEAFLLLIPVAV